MIKRIRRFLLPFLYKGAKIYWFFTRPKTKGVKCAIVFERNILLVRHSYAHDKWTIPGGGIQKNENYKDAAIREVREEVGIDVQEVYPIGQYKDTIDFKDDTVYCFQGKAETEDFVIDNVEIIEAKWFPLDHLPNYRSKQTSIIIDMI